MARITSAPRHSLHNALEQSEAKTNVGRQPSHFTASAEDRSRDRKKKGEDVMRLCSSALNILFDC